MTNLILLWIGPVILGSLLILAAYFYFNSKTVNLPKKIKILSLAGIVFLILSASIKTVFQYYGWSKDAFSQLLLPPHQSIAYFFQYSFTHFWLGALLAIISAAIFYVFLKALQKKQERFFKEGEVELGFLAALVCGWPNFVVFIPLVFVATVLIGIFRAVFLKESYTTLGYPIIFSSVVIFLSGDKIIKTLNLIVLRA